MRQFAVIGSGPAGFYTVEALAKAYGADAHIDLIDRLPVPYGLIRFGVAPDHQSIKAVSRRYDKVADEEAVRFVGNVAVGRDVTIAELATLYDAVVLATGAPNDRPLGIPGEDLPGVVGSAAFVGCTMATPISPTSTRRWTARRRRLSAMAMSRSTSRGSCPRPAPSSPDPTSSTMPSTRSKAPPSARSRWSGAAAPIRSR